MWRVAWGPRGGDKNEGWTAWWGDRAAVVEVMKKLQRRLPGLMFFIERKV